MSRKLTPIEGTRFASLVVQYIDTSVLGGRTKYVCLCDCGTITSVARNNLFTGNTTSCGCAGRAARVTHGQSATKLYSKWEGIIQRCTNPNHKQFKDYGGRGIEVCAAWREFSQFAAEIDAPPFDGAELDRIDNHKGYEPGNVKWSTHSENNRNTRRNRPITYRGRTQLLCDWVAELGAKHSTLHHRIAVHGVEIAFSKYTGGLYA